MDTDSLLGIMTIRLLRYRFQFFEALTYVTAPSTQQWAPVADCFPWLVKGLIRPELRPALPVLSGSQCDFLA
jgi:hypothetical protein